MKMLPHGLRVQHVADKTAVHLLRVNLYLLEQAVSAGWKPGATDKSASAQRLVVKYVDVSDDGVRDLEGNAIKHDLSTPGVMNDARVQTLSHDVRAGSPMETLERDDLRYPDLEMCNRVTPSVWSSKSAKEQEQDDLTPDREYVGDDDTWDAAGIYL